MRRAIHAATRQTILLNPHAVTGGRYSVVEWEHTHDPSRSIPIIAVNPTRTVLPTNYDVHECPTPENVECPTCQGVGSSYEDHVGNCPDCGGTGRTPESVEEP